MSKKSKTTKSKETQDVESADTPVEVDESVEQSGDQEQVDKPTQSMENAPQFSAVLHDTSQIIDSLTVMKNLVDEIAFDVLYDNIHIGVIDPSHVAMVDITLPKECFTVLDVANVGSVKIPLGNFLDVLHSMPKGKEVTISGTDATKSSLRIHTNKNTAHVKITDGTYDPLPKVKMEYKVTIGMDRVRLINSLTQISMVSDHVKLAVQKNGLMIISGSGDKGEREVQLDTEIDVVYNEAKESIDSVFSLNYLFDVLKKTKSTFINLELAQTMPLKISMPAYEVKSTYLGINGFGTVVFHLAPRVES